MTPRVHITAPPRFRNAVARLADRGHPVISRWIEAGPRLDKLLVRKPERPDRELVAELWPSRIEDAASCTDLIIKCDEHGSAWQLCGDLGFLVEAGAALANGARVWQVGRSSAFTTSYYRAPADFTRMPGWMVAESVTEALHRIHAGVVPRPDESPGIGRTGGAYVSSKVAHAGMWRDMRQLGEPIISSWIDLEPSKANGPGEIGRKHWPRWLGEARAASSLVFYSAPGDHHQTGCLLEIGAALAAGARIIEVGRGKAMQMLRLWRDEHLLPNVVSARTLDEAFREVREIQREFHGAALGPGPAA